MSSEAVSSYFHSNEPADTIAPGNDPGTKIAEGINEQHWRADAGYDTPGPIVNVTCRVLAARQLAEGAVFRLPENRTRSGMVFLTTTSEEGSHTTRLFLENAARR